MLREELEFSMGIPLTGHRESGLATKGAVPLPQVSSILILAPPPPGAHAESLGPETVVAQFDHFLRQLVLGNGVP